MSRSRGSSRCLRVPPLCHAWRRSVSALPLESLRSASRGHVLQRAELFVHDVIVTVLVDGGPKHI